MSTFTVELEVNDNGDFILPIPQEIIEKLNLKVGDSIYWEHTDNGIALNKCKGKSKEYQCVYLDSRYTLWHDEHEPILFETDDLSEAIGYVYERFMKEHKSIAVWQPSAKHYREHYFTEIP